LPNIRFSFVTAGSKEKLSKRKRRRMFRLCGGDQRSARWIGGRFLKKATEKLSQKHRHGVLESPINQNLKTKNN
jgi:hypothetical protein